MKRYIGMIASAVCGILLFFLGVGWQGTAGVSGAKEWVRIFSNAALVPGVLITGMGLLVRIAGEDVFSGLHYAAATLLTHLAGRKKRYDTYYEYLHREKKKDTPVSVLLVGLVFLAGAAILTGVYYVL